MLLKTAFQSRTILSSSPRTLTPPLGLGLTANLDVSDAVPTLSSLAAFVLDAAPDSVDEMRKFGEHAFAAAFAIAFCQAMVALFQYSNNPSGQLVVPPGLTCGTENPNPTEPGSSSQSADGKKTPWILALKELELESNFVAHDKNEPTTLDDKIKTKRATNRFSAIVHRMNRSLVFLMPWASNMFGFLLKRNVHLFHLGFMVAMAQLFDFPNRFVDNHFDNQHALADRLDSHKPPERIVVLGDSLAAGVGTVDVFENNQEEDIPVDNCQTDNGPGPVFPRVLAQTLSQHTGNPVHWRSAAVVGGDTKDIEEHCLGVIQEEVGKGQPPDLVVLICGINDLKHFACNPLKNAGPKEFRSRLTNLITKIRKLSPETKVVLPSLPTQMFRRDSPLNIFPLTFFVSGVVGFWDSQKKLVANRFPGVRYLGISAKEIYEWYMTDASKYGVPVELDDNGEIDMSLISADGIHPSARCYAHWAASLGNKLATELPEETIISIEQSMLQEKDPAYAI